MERDDRNARMFGWRKGMHNDNEAQDPEIKPVGRGYGSAGRGHYSTANAVGRAAPGIRQDSRKSVDNDRDHGWRDGSGDGSSTKGNAGSDWVENVPTASSGFGGGDHVETDWNGGENRRRDQNGGGYGRGRGGNGSGFGNGGRNDYRRGNEDGARSEYGRRNENDGRSDYRRDNEGERRNDYRRDNDGERRNDYRRNRDDGGRGNSYRTPKGEDDWENKENADAGSAEGGWDGGNDNRGGSDRYNNGDSGRGRGRGRGRSFSHGNRGDDDYAGPRGFGDDDGVPSGGGFHNADERRSRQMSNSGDNDEPNEKPKTTGYVNAELSEDVSVIRTGINFDKYDDLPVKVSGTDLPKPITIFPEAGFGEALLKNIKRREYKRPTPIQKNAIPIILAKRDLMACAQTGSGKTAAFLLPILKNLIRDASSASFKQPQEPHALILVPTRELARQIAEESNTLALGTILKTQLIYGGPHTHVLVQRLSKGCHVLVATTGRLKDFVGRGLVSFNSLQYFVLDEADQMLKMGFLEDVKELLSDPSMPSKDKRCTLMFSATFPEEIQKMARDEMNDYIFLSIGQVGGANHDVRQEIIKLESISDKRDKLFEIMGTVSKTEKVLVFINQKRLSDFVTSYLCQKGFSATSIHGDREQPQREEALSQFKSGEMQVLVGTAVCSRGLDIPYVAHVINYDLPKDIVEYVHRIGRTGRVGNLGRATAFYNPSCDKHLAGPLVDLLKEANQPVPDWLEEEAGDAGSYGGRSYGHGAHGGRDIRYSKGNREESTGYDQQPSQVQEEESWD